MKKTILLTLDYELYGNGSGDVFKHMIEPTNRILEIAQKYNLRLTFFFEIVEYWKLKKEWEKGNNMGYTQNPVAAIENQLCISYKAGHDIQLHIHPQWVDAVYEDGKWNVNLNDWRLSCYNRIGEYSLLNLFQKGKETIENLIKPIDPNYECIALRAGGYNIQPSYDIVKVMKKTGIYVDSSVYPGGKETGILSDYDYSSIPFDIGYWFVSDELEKIGKSELVELPIVAFPMNRWEKYLSLERMKSIFQNHKSAKDTFNAKLGGSIKGKFALIKYFFEREWQTWDYCLFSPAMHKKFLSLAQKQKDRNIFVLVGHPKSFVNGKGFEYLLNQTQCKFNYKTIIEVYKDGFK